MKRLLFYGKIFLTEMSQRKNSRGRAQRRAVTFGLGNTFLRRKHVRETTPEITLPGLDGIRSLTVG